MCPIPTVDQLKELHREEMLNAPTRPEGHEPYDLKAPEERVEPTYGVFRAISHIRRTEVPEPPESLFFSTVFDFPWRSLGAIIRWSLVSFGFSTVGLLVWLAFYMLNFGFVAAIAAGCSVLGVAVIGFISAGYATSCVFSILQETAAGVNTIEEWPDEGWKDGLFEFMLVLWLHAVSGFFCYIAALGVQALTGSLYPALLVLHAFLFPLALISAMDSESAWLPISPMALRSVKRLPTVWALFYVITVALICMTGGVWYLLVSASPVVGALTAGPFTATIAFLYARLLGRLAWKIGDDASAEVDPEVAEL